MRIVDPVFIEVRYTCINSNISSLFRGIIPKTIFKPSTGAQEVVTNQKPNESRFISSVNSSSPNVNTVEMMKQL